MTHPWRTGTVESGGETIYYEVTGAGTDPVVLLTHGAGGSHAAWFQQVPALAAAGYRVVTWDSRGFGLSTLATGSLGAAEAVADMVTVLDAVDARAAHLIGQSMGGWWVTAFALAHPERVRSLTLSNTVGGLWTDALRVHFAAWAGTAPGADERRLGVHSALSPSFAARDPAHAFLYQQLNTFHSPPMAAVGRALTGTRVEHAALDAVGVPILVITGTDDELFPAPLVTESAGMLARSRVVEIADAGHSPYFERPGQYNAALLEFLATASDAPSSSRFDETS
ncbi:MAG TPA: alpha/beta hydrolase [Acidimicrobiia bacterium]|nr:alpha/beta hydrolase [Acidimicrobiia bacterium]